MRYFYLVTAFILAGCGNYRESNNDGPSTQQFKTLSYEAVKEMVFRQSCFDCHSNANAPQKGNGISLENYDTVTSRMSSIISDLQSDRMPKDSRPKVADKLKQIVYAWANAGMPVTSDKPMPGDDTKVPVPPEPKILVGFDQVRDKVFQPYCTRCHGFMNDYATSKKNIAKILAAVDEEDPDLRMPFQSAPLSQKNKDLLQQWVNDGLLIGGEEVRQKVLIPYCTRCHGTFSNGATVSKMALDIWSKVMSDDMPRNGDPVPDNLKQILDQWFKTGAAN